VVCACYTYNVSIKVNTSITIYCFVGQHIHPFSVQGLKICKRKFKYCHIWVLLPLSLSVSHCLSHCLTHSHYSLSVSLTVCLSHCLIHSLIHSFTLIYSLVHNCLSLTLIIHTLSRSHSLIYAGLLEFLGLLGS